MLHTAVVYANKRQQRTLQTWVSTVLTAYPDSLLVEVSDEQIDHLLASGYSLEVLEGINQIDVGGETVDTSISPLEFPTYRRAARGVDAHEDAPHHYLVQFIGPIKAEWLQAVERAGGVLREPLPSYAYVVELTPDAYQNVSNLPWVRWVGYYEPNLRVSPELRQNLEEPQRRWAPPQNHGAAASTGEGDGSHTDDGSMTVTAKGESQAGGVAEAPPAEPLLSTFTVRFFTPEQLQAAVPTIEALGGEVSGALNKMTVVATVSFPPATPDLQAKVMDLAYIHGVKSVDQFLLRQVRNNIAARLMGALAVMSPNEPGLTGKGEVIGVADTGLDSGDTATIHPDFAGRVAAIQSWPISADYNSVILNKDGNDGPADLDSGHGTHVAGSALGSGAASAQHNEVIRGLAPEATLVFQAIEQKLEWTPAYRQAFRQRYGRDPAPFGLAGLPADLYAFFEKAYEAGVRIHNNSWGGGALGAYDNYCEALDRFVWEHKDFVTLVAAGNDGVDYDRDGKIDPTSVTPPATAKNCITVGAAESERANAGYQAAWGQLWPRSYGRDPIRTDRVSDNGADIAAFSSRGPTRDGRIKPDIVAPGTNIVSTRSHHLSGGRHGWGEYSPLTADYLVNGGTSMATPLATGAVALLRQFLRQHGRRNPSAALLKALLLHGATYRPYRYGATGGAPYDFEQGWGHLNVAESVQPALPRAISMYDRVRGLVTGRSVRLSAIVSDGSIPFKATLVWTDFPSSASQTINLINDLDLIVTAPDGQNYHGNQFGAPYNRNFDRKNNVEMVVIASPAAGRYLLTVRAHNVPRGPQDFALVWSGGLG